MRPFHDDPLFTVRDDRELASFLGVPDISTLVSSPVDLICEAFSRLPYENLTKVIKRSDVIAPSSAQRLPDEVIADHLRYGTGGTCFSLTAALIAVLSRFGVAAWPVLADRRYGTDTHCAVLLTLNGTPHLVDPGYLIHRPVALPDDAARRYENRFNTVELAPAGPQRVDLFTLSGADRRYRLTYKTVAVDGAAFAAAWQRSFAWEMMTYPVLTRVTAAAHCYLQGTELRVRENDRTSRVRFDEELSGEFIARHIGIDPAIVKRAFGVWGHGA
ncbi:MAG TPA: arylamine N-acetyltransferase [bacterium]|nr:arylamine N-acetyltransferase [bacterium]